MYRLYVIYVHHNPLPSSVPHVAHVIGWAFNWFGHVHKSLWVSVLFWLCIFLWYSEAVAVWPIFKLYSYSRDIVFLVEKKQEKQILGWASCIDGFFIKCVIFKKISVPITVTINFTKTLMCWFSFFSWFKRQHGACGILVKAQGL